jgi:hypothetical protein
MEPLDSLSDWLLVLLNEDTRFTSLPRRMTQPMGLEKRSTMVPSWSCIDFDLTGFPTTRA